MLCEWRIRKKGSNADPYVDYGAFSTVFCLKINYGGAFTPPPKIRYKGGKVNWVDAIDSDVFFVVEVNTMMKEIGYEKPSFDYYYKEPKNDLDNGLKKLSSDQDVLRESLNVDESLLVNELDNDLFIGNQELGNNDEDVIEDVSEDEWLQNCLRKVEYDMEDGSHRDHASDRKDGSNRGDGSNKEDVSNSDDDSDSQDSDFLVDPDNTMDDVDVDMAEFRSNIDANVEWVGSKDIVTVEEEEDFVDEKVNLEKLDSRSDCEYEEIKKMMTRVAVEHRRELHLKNNDKIRVRFICKGKVPQFSSEDIVDDSSSKGVESIKPNPKIPLNALKDQLQEQYEVGISKKKVFRAKKMAQERVEGHLKAGFKAGKRDLLGLDGCCLSGSYPRWILTAGIIPPIAESFPSAEHRFCLKHIYDNMKLSWRGQLFKEMLWNLLHPKVSRGRAHCDVLLNNMCEVLNKQLVDGRHKPIITCLEFIREYLMKITVNVQKVICKSDGPLTPNATKILNKIMKNAGQLKTQQSSQAPTATQPTQASQTDHTTPFHPSQLHASPTKLTKATARRMSST
nr:hypothetical protein [Tanacetum cinerariifolium]